VGAAYQIDIVAITGVLAGGNLEYLPNAIGG
jgi:hypothetical protein